MMASTRRVAGTAQGIMLLLPSTLVVMGIIVLVSVLPAMAAHFTGLSYPDIRFGVLLTTPALMVVLFTDVADLLGRRRLLIAAVVVYACAGVPPFFMEAFWPILASRVVVGLCEAVVITTSTAMIGDYFADAERDKWLGYQVAVASAGATVLILISVVFGWQGPFLVYVLPLPLAAGVAAVGRGAGHLPRRAGRHHVLGRLPQTGLCGHLRRDPVRVLPFFYLTQVEMSFALTRLGVTNPQRVGILISLASIESVVGSIAFKRFSTQPVARLLGINLCIAGVMLVGMGLAAPVGVLVPAAFVNEAGRP